MIEAIAELGEVDLFTLHDIRRGDEFEVPPSIKVRRVRTVLYPGAPRQLHWRLKWLAQRSLPLEVSMRMLDRSPRIQFEAWAAERYDLVWFSTAATFIWMGRPNLGPTVIDLVDLEDEKARQRAGLLRTLAKPRDGVDFLKLRVAAAQASKNARDWIALQESVAKDVDRVVLCSESDVKRSGFPNALSIPNTYPAPTSQMGSVVVGDPPVVLLQGSLRYAPNIDGADWLVGDIGPLLRHRIPNVQIRLVGRATAGVERHNHPPQVVVTGQVPDMEPELERADLAVVPLRIGSGTRLKILESFAHRIPVVSTRLGADGLDVEDGVHLLLADDAEAFADACQRLLTDPELRQRLVNAAEALYLDRYEWTAAKEKVGRLVSEVTKAGPEVRGPVPLN
jgi:glycosyltransferase involved in cell wall biosynthesis